MTTILLSLCALSTYAVEFLSTEPADNLFNLGVRIGVNASNKTFPSEKFTAWNVNSWGSGFEAGVVADINIRQYLSIQPGIFFESRSGNYSYSENYINKDNEADYFTQLGHLRTYNFTIPVLASIKLNIANNLQWLLEAGPYLQFKLHASDSNKIQVIDQPTPTSPLKVEYAKNRFADWGLKIGTGIRFDTHYSFAIHYLAGANNVWKSPVEGGKNKAWTFTLGYDF
ncbi:MAG: PorT family protein [Bacteroides sp.]|nr:PorT family protein [Bacteroides sp.]